jgi:endonuclease/exonuclease/phosphatase family metal-dependent hydrolase
MGVASLRIVTYNVHKCRGMDGRTSVARIGQVLAGLEADVIALQEIIGAGRLKPGQESELGAALGMASVMAPTRRRWGRLYGNAVLSRLPVDHAEQRTLTEGISEPRACQRVDLRTAVGLLHVYNVHLGTGVLERRRQAARLVDYAASRDARGPKIVLGDFNEWRRGQATRLLSERMESLDVARLLDRRRTYPGVFPLLHLDHVYYDGPIDITGADAPRTRLTLLASDHLPLVVDVRIRG